MRDPNKPKQSATQILTPEGRAARKAFFDAESVVWHEPEDWNAIAKAAIEASDEVKRLREEIRLLRSALASCPGDYHTAAQELSYKRVHLTRF